MGSLRLPCLKKADKDLKSFSGPGYLNKPVYNMVKEYLAAIGKPTKLARHFSIKVILLRYDGENSNGPYTRDYGGVHGLNWCHAGSFSSKIGIVPEKDGIVRGRSMQTLRHEVMHSIISGYLSFPGMAHGYKYLLGRGNMQGHPEFLITPKGRKLHVPSMVRGRWPSRIIKAGNLAIGNGYELGVQHPCEKLYVDGVLICNHTLREKDNDEVSG